MKEIKNPFSYKSSDDATGFLLWQVHNFWQREIKKKLKPLDLTHTQFVILANSYWLLLQNNNTTQIEIAHQANSDVMMTSNVLRTLEKKKFITRKVHKTDSRAKSIQLTDKGIEILTMAVKTVEDFDRSFFGKVSDVSLFNDDLKKLL